MTDKVLYMTNEEYRRAGGGRPLEIYRPKIINFMFLDGYEMRDITIRNPACWTQTYEICSNLKFENITVRSRTYWNNDGFDLTDCRNATINNCDVDSGDDGICLKSYYKGYCCENIRVTNCKVTSSCNALKLGTASFGGFRNIVFDNVKVKDTYLSAIAIESVDGCDIDSITFRNITATNTMNPLFIKLGNRTNGPAGHVRNILIENLTATVPFLRPDAWAEMRIVSNEGYHNPHPAPITGMPEQPIEGVTLRHIDITFPGHASTGMKYVPLWRVESVREDHRSYPEFTMYGELPIASGEAQILEYDIARLKRKQVPYLRRKLGVVFQDFQLLTDRNVEENLLFVLRATGWRDKNAMKSHVMDVLDQVGMANKAYKMPYQLSGGEQQRVVIARALLNMPSLILADEPTGNLDHETGKEIMDLLYSISKAGITIIMSTHNIIWPEQYPGRKLYFAAGKISEE